MNSASRTPYNSQTSDESCLESEFPTLVQICKQCTLNKITQNIGALCSCDRASWVKRGERKPTRYNNIDDLLSIVDVDYWHCLNMLYIGAFRKPAHRN